MSTTTHHLHHKYYKETHLLRVRRNERRKREREMRMWTGGFWLSWDP